MNIIHTTSFMSQRFTSDAHIFSARPVSRDIVSDLLYAQMVVEGKWLEHEHFPVFAIPAPYEPFEYSCVLFEDVRLIRQEGWDIIDTVDTFLLNSRMYELCKADEDIYANLKISTAAELRTLFDNEMFVVAAAGRIE